MSRRLEITKYVLETLDLPRGEKQVRDYNIAFWQNPRQKAQGGYRLTEFGFEMLTKAGIKSYEVSYPEKNPFISNKLIIQLDNFIDCPFFLGNKSIMVFGEKMAVQLVLFSGDIQKYGTSRERFRLTHTQK